MGVRRPRATAAHLWASGLQRCCRLSGFNKFTQAGAEMFRKFTHLMFS
jgi:hypothetical protein